MYPFFARIDFNEWKVSIPMRIASEKLGALCGAIMNSWKSTVLSACLPPLMMFMHGTGRSDAFTPPR